MGQSVVFYGPVECVIEAITGSLSRHGYHVVRSFDLQSARAQHAADVCACPHHGTSECTCQYVVLLAYPPARAGHPASPCVVTAHSYEQRTEVALHTGGLTIGGGCAGAFSALLEAAQQADQAQEPADEQDELAPMMVYC